MALKSLGVPASGLSDVVTKSDIDSVRADLLSKGAVVVGPGNSQAEIQAAINASGNRSVLFAPGIYTPAAAWDLPSGSAVKGSPGTVIDLSTLGGEPAFRAVGTTAGAAVALTVAAMEGSRTVTLASASTLAPGDWVKIYSTTPVSTAVPTTIGEIQRIRSISGNVLTFSDPVSRSYLTGASAAVQKLSLVSDVSVEGFRFIGVEASITTSYLGVKFDTCKNVSVRSCSFRFVHYAAIWLADTVFARVSDCHFEDALNVGTAYGVAVLWASQDVTVSNCTSLRVRHAVTSGGGGSRPGTARRIAVSAFSASESIDSAFDAHPGCDYFSVTGCHILGGAGDGIISQGRCATIVGNTITGVAAYGIFLQGVSIGGLQATIANNVITRTGGIGIWVQPDSTVAQRVWNGVTISGNVLTDTGSTGIEVMQTAGGFYGEMFTIVGNTVRRPTGNGISLRGVRDVSVSGNSVARATATFACIMIFGAVDASVTGNTLNGEGVSAYGVRLVSSATNCVVVGNRIRGCTNGVHQAADSGPAVVVGNLTTERTTGYTLSATGNSAANNL